MKTVIIGSGNVAEALALTVKSMRPGTGKPELVQICARNRNEGSALAAKAMVPYTSSFDKLADAGLYILAVSDSAIPEVSSRMNVPAGAVVVHTAGSIGMDAISGHIANKGVIYPFQTFTKGRRTDLSKVPVFIEYSDPQAERAVRNFAYSLSHRVLQSTADTRTRVHLAGVFANNFVNHMYAVAGHILNDDGLSFDIVKPLIEETTAKALSAIHPASVQTGPAVRGDQVTIRRHLELIESGAPEGSKEKIKEMYLKITENIWETSKKK